ncbi:MAG: DUF481 domain-containing protein [Leptothrix sp. (in: b-proteobacteria)]
MSRRASRRVSRRACAPAPWIAALSWLLASAGARAIESPRYSWEPPPPAEVVDLSRVVPADERLERDAIGPEVPLVKFNLGMSFAFDRSSYATRRWASDGDVEYKYTHSEINGDYRIKREYVPLQDNAGNSLSRDEYDTHLQWKQWVDDNPYYGYLLPRVRYNRFGFYRSSQAFSAGVGRRFEPGSGDLKLTFEAGPGVRSAQPQAGGSLVEGMYTMAVKVDFAVSQQLAFKLNLIDERSTRENYRTLTASLRNRLTERLSLKYELAYRKAFPFDSAPSSAESSLNAGLVYRF